ncbi:MAG: TlpA family protein disulfide reductase [Candidatus Marinimicrobia bacterium]|nr:TlpA family protein disulfide reductase [Candidatus Neomarinimicrobiota bacterium]MBL7059784.1 TlpA family protein disulfide reductase [Candidatus Neomarinimicrobiota bacterium]
MRKILVVGIWMMAIAGMTLAEGCGEKDNAKAATSKKIVKPQSPRPAGAVLAPEFSLATLDGDILSMSDLQGKVILLNFWATWCAPCRKEIPDFIKLYDKYNEAGLEIVGVTLSSGSPDKIQQFVDKWKMNYPVLTDIQGQETQQTAMVFGQAVRQPISGVPTTFIIDRDGYIVKMYVGPRSEEIFYRDLKPYL